MEPKINLDFRSQQELRGIYLVYRLAQNLNDYLHQQSSFDDSRLYWSTTFIQAHFSSEIVSSINWRALTERNTIEPWSAEMNKALSPVDKMRAMLKFCYDNLGDEAPAKFNGIFAEKLKNLSDPFTILGTRGFFDNVHQNQAHFEERFRKITQDKSLSRDEHAVLVFKMLRYVYSVRDNFFQGLALISIPLDENMQLRFQIYSDLLLALCDFLFHTVGEISNWDHQDVIMANQLQYDYFSKAFEESSLRNRGRRILSMQHSK